MRFLVINADYAGFLRWLYAQHPGLEGRPYDAQMQARVESLFGVADFYSRNLRALGHEAFDVYANNESMQRAWAREHGVPLRPPSLTEQRVKKILAQVCRSGLRAPLPRIEYFLEPFHRSLERRESWFSKIMAAQIKHYRPDVLLNQAMDVVEASLLRELKPQVRLLVGQIASPIPQGEDFSCYDLVVSSLPNLVQQFRQWGVRAELNRLAFDPRVLDKLELEEKIIPVSFVGSFYPEHKTRVQLLEQVCREVDLAVWGQGFERMPEGSRTRESYRGKAWGVEMYQILQRSKMTLNQHSDVAESYANNMRLYEATGVGSMLVTDCKANLQEMFEPGKEVVAYRTSEECTELVRYYLEHDREREAIARAGQQRTLREHTYFHRMQELVEIVHKYL